MQLQKALQLGIDPHGNAGTFIDQDRVELDQAGAGPDPLEGIDAIVDSAGGDQRERPAGRPAKVAEPFERQPLQRQPGQAARFAAMRRRSAFSRMKPAASRWS